MKYPLKWIDIARKVRGGRKQLRRYLDGYLAPKKWQFLAKFIRIQIVPAEKQRYDTLGDWFHVKLAEETEECAMIRVTDLGDDRYNFLIAFHELIEMVLCEQRGISSFDVDNFDLAFEGRGEPGDHPAAPYFREHQFAMMMEKLMAHELGVDWDEYNKRCEIQNHLNTIDQ